MPVDWAGIESRVKAAAVSGLNQGADMVSASAKAHAPVLTGKLQSEIEAVHATGGGSHFEAQVISPTPYARWQEFGSGHNKPHPYLRPALHESHVAVTELVRSEVRAAINGVKATEEVEL